MASRLRLILLSDYRLAFYRSMQKHMPVNSQACMLYGSYSQEFCSLGVRSTPMFHLSFPIRSSNPSNFQNVHSNVFQSRPENTQHHCVSCPEVYCVRYFTWNLLSLLLQFWTNACTMLSCLGTLSTV